MKTIVVESQKHGTQHILVDDDDYELVSRHTWHVVVSGNTKKTYYAKTNLPRDKNGKRRSPMCMHRLIMKCEPGDGKIIDHKDGDGLNNTKENLRFATQSQNQMNKGKTNRSKTGYLGVYDCGDSTTNKYIARVNKDGVRHHVGRFSCKIEAAKARDKMAKEIHGEFARLNFPEEENIIDKVHKIYPGM